MDKTEFETKRYDLELEQLRVEVDSQRAVSVLDCKSITQERIRRNIEVCVSVIKVSSVVKCAELESEALTKISELMKQLTI